MSRMLALVSVIGLLLCASCLGLARIIGGDDVFHDPRALEGIRPLIDLATRKEWRWAGGDTLAMDAPMTVRYQPHGTPNVTVTGPSEALEHLRFNAGRISADTPAPPATNGKVRAVVSGISIRKFVINNGESLELGHVDQDSLDIHINGRGRVNGDGKVRELSLTVSGPGHADLGGLAVGDANVSLLGDGMATLSPHGKVKAFLAGNGRLALLTKPESLDRKMLGSGMITVGAENVTPPLPRPPGSSAVSASPAPQDQPAPPMPRAKFSSGNSVVVRTSENLDLGQINQDQMNATIASSGNLTATGRVGRLKVQSMGSGRAELGKLAAHEANVVVGGSGDVTLGAVDELEITILGSGNVHLAKRPTDIRSTIIGSGRIIIDQQQ